MSAVTSTGGLLPRDLLERVAAHDSTLDGTSPISYGLAQGERLNNAITQSWNRLGTLWERFRAEWSALDDSDRAAIGLTRRRFTLPLLEELGFVDLSPSGGLHAGGADYPISHEWAGSVAVHLVGAGVAIDKRTPGVPGAARISPHGLVQEFLNRSSKHLWAIVSNGRRLRLLRDNSSLTRQAYLDVDLAALLDGEQDSDFRVLWLTCHRTRFEGDRPESCLLERWTQEAASSGIRVLDRQREGVERAITALGKGFIRQPNPELKQRLRSGLLSTEDYHRQVLRVIYRLLFLLVAEARDLLLTPEADSAARKRYERFYSVRRLVALADRQRGSPHRDLWEGFRVVVRALSGTTLAPSLDLQPLGSFLWSPDATPDLNDATIDNAHLLDAVRALAWVFDEGSHVRRPVDYRNLGSEELGSVYESLLELRAEIDVDKAAFHLVTVAGNERKTTGSYYTPSALLSRLLNDALDPVLDEAERASDSAEALLALRILDPACGSGHFLIAAAHRIAGRLASARCDGSEPSSVDLREALRDVIGRCVHGIDINPMAVELCKVSLWLEANMPGHPLGFLDHHIVVGNSLLGTTPELFDAGVPDTAFKPLTGDDKAWVKTLRKTNRGEREQRAQLAMDLRWSTGDTVAELAEDLAVIEAGPEDSVDDVVAKADLFANLQDSPEYLHARLAADAWCAAFVVPKAPDQPLITDSTVRAVADGREIAPYIEAAVSEVAEKYKFVHLHLAFPEVFNRSDGFDAVLGNPPWDQIQYDPRETFAASHPEIAEAPTMAKRSAMLRALATTEPDTHRRYLEDVRHLDGVKHFLHASGRYPLGSVGRLNTAPLFVELMWNGVAARGRVGVIAPTGIATDSFTQGFFRMMIERGSLASLHDFENGKPIFPGVHRSYKFCLLTLLGSKNRVRESLFSFFAREYSDLDDPERAFNLSPDDFDLLNPNTKTCPIFRTNRDAEITKAIYRRVRPFVRDDCTDGNPWDVSFQLMFMMNTDSSLFRTREELESEGYILEGNSYCLPRPVSESDEQRDDREFVSDHFVPLYEGKMIHQFDHRWASYSNGRFRSVTPEEKRDPTYTTLPRYWIPAVELSERATNSRLWFQGWRDVARSTDARTLIFAAHPRLAVGHKLPQIVHRSSETSSCLLVAILSSFACDYMARQKVGGTSITFFIVKQIPIVSRTSEELERWIEQRILELCYTAWDMVPFANSLRHNGPPFFWNSERRSLLRAELDALMFHLYGISRVDAAYIMDTFPLVRRKDTKDHGGYRTKNLIVDRYDAISDAYEGLYGTLNSSPNGHEPPLDHPSLDTYSIRLTEVLRDNYRSNIEPPPGDPSCCHPESTRPSWAS